MCESVNYYYSPSLLSLVAKCRDMLWVVIRARTEEADAAIVTEASTQAIGKLDRGVQAPVDSPILHLDLQTDKETETSVMLVGEGIQKEVVTMTTMNMDIAVAVAMMVVGTKVVAMGALADEQVLVRDW